MLHFGYFGNYFCYCIMTAAVIYMRTKVYVCECAVVDEKCVCVDVMTRVCLSRRERKEGGKRRIKRKKGEKEGGEGGRRGGGKGREERKEGEK